MLASVERAGAVDEGRAPFDGDEDRDKATPAIAAAAVARISAAIATSDGHRTFGAPGMSGTVRRRGRRLRWIRHNAPRSFSLSLFIVANSPRPATARDATAWPRVLTAETTALSVDPAQANNADTAPSNAFSPFAAGSGNRVHLHRPRPA